MHLLLIDIGNTHTHLALAGNTRIVKTGRLSTPEWGSEKAQRQLRRFIGRTSLGGASLCSVVPAATRKLLKALSSIQPVPCFELNARSAPGLVVPSYPKPDSIGPDRLANVVAARHLYGTPCLSVDFGTAVTFDVVNKRGQFAGGVISPGIALMTHYLHERTALLPEVKPGPVKTCIGNTTEEAMRIAAVRGFRGLVREIITGIKTEMKCPEMPVVFTGGYADWIANELPGMALLEPNLTFHGLHLAWEKWMKK